MGRGLTSVVRVVRRFGIVGQHQVPAVEAVFAAVGDVVARQPHAVFARLGEQVTSPATIDADDQGLGFQRDAVARYTVIPCQMPQSPTMRATG